MFSNRFQPAGGMSAELRAYISVTQVVAWIGLLLAPVLIFGDLIFVGPHLRDSISAYYYSPVVGRVFVGSVFALGIALLMFWFTRVDHWLGLVACLGAIGTSLFPTAPAGAQRSIVGWVHVVASGALLAALAAIAFFVFTHHDEPGRPTWNKDTRDVWRQTVADDDPRKQRRNRLYRVCGVLSALGTVGALLSAMVPMHGYWFLASEIIAIEPFGVAWLVKSGFRWERRVSGPRPLAG